MFRRVLLGVLALGALWLLAAFLRSVLSSDEEKIRRLVADMEEAYNEGSPGGCVGPLAKDWRHEGHELDRELLRGALFQVARERDRETRELRSRVEVDEEALAIAVEGERATLTAEATFSRLRAGAWEPVWSVTFEAELVDGDDGWEIVRSRHEDRRGTHLGR